ncbi:MAG: hypothetical protein KIS67_22605 [Verrucomicrobiae bacterium]|nr:hypothetical protein [Verrucomicrobiae bacterium]
MFKDAIIPLPTDCLLGARSLPERDAVFESVAISFVSKVHQTEFIGFKSYESDGTKHYDPPPEFLKRLRAINGRLRPISDLSQINDTERDSYWRQLVPAFYLYGIKPISEDEVEAYVESVPILVKPHGTFFICRVKKQDGKWTTISKERQIPSVLTM